MSIGWEGKRALDLISCFQTFRSFCLTLSQDLDANLYIDKSVDSFVSWHRFHTLLASDCWSANVSGAASSQMLTKFNRLHDMNFRTLFNDSYQVPDRRRVWSTRCSTCIMRHTWAAAYLSDRKDCLQWNDDCDDDGTRSLLLFSPNSCISTVVPGAFVHLKRDRFKAACNLLRTLSPILSNTHSLSLLLHSLSVYSPPVGARIGRQIEVGRCYSRFTLPILLSLPRNKCIACTVFPVSV